MCIETTGPPSPSFHHKSLVGKGQALLGIGEAGGQAQLSGSAVQPERPSAAGSGGGRAGTAGGAQCSPEWSSPAPPVVFTQQFHLRPQCFRNTLSEQRHRTRFSLQHPSKGKVQMT